MADRAFEAVAGSEDRGEKTQRSVSGTRWELSEGRLESFRLGTTSLKMSYSQR
jgi:hypothetical protein